MVARKEVMNVTKSERFEQLDRLLTEHDGMLQTAQVIASGIVKPIFYEYVKEKHRINPGILGDINSVSNLLKIFLFDIFIKNGFYNSAGDYLRCV